MPYDGLTTYCIVEELKDKLIHGKINKVYQPESDEIILNIVNMGSKYNLLLSANNNNPRVYLLSKRKDNPLSPPMFCMLLRKNISHGIIIDIKQISLDRIIEIKISTKNELGDSVTKKLIVEIMGRHSNVILVNEEDSIIVDSIKRVSKNISSYREVLPGKEYKSPPQSKTEPRGIDFQEFQSIYSSFNRNKSLYKFILDSFIGFSPSLSREICHRAKLDSDVLLEDLDEDKLYKVYEVISLLVNNLKDNSSFTMYTNDNQSKIYDFSTIDYTYYELYKKIPYDSLSELLEDYYYLRDNLERIKNKSSDILQMLHNHLERNYNKRGKQLDEYQKAEDAEIYKKYGELITSQIHSLKKGQSTAKLTDYYTGEEIEIPLSVQLSPAENAQKYYKKYNKGKRAKEYLREQIKLTEDEIYYLESLIDNVGKCTEIKEFNEIKEELTENGYIKSHGAKKGRKESSLSKPLKYLYNGVEIYIGKNNKQNEYLTMKFASKTDLWLHVKDIPGSHTIVKMDYMKASDELLYTAALLAAYYSKAKGSSNVPVDYTAVKYVKKPKGAKTGMVIYTDQKTLYVTPNEEEVLKLNKIF